MMCDKQREMIELKAALNDTGQRPSFATDGDFPYNNPGMHCELLMGDEAVEAWAEAQNNLRAASPDVIDTLLSNVGELEIKEGAAPEAGDAVEEVVFDPWRYERNRRIG